MSIRNMYHIGDRPEWRLLKPKYQSTAPIIVIPA